MIDLCLIDLDGTLVDTSRDIAAAVNVVRRRFDRPDAPVETVIEWVGDGMSRLVRRALDGIELSEREWDQAVRLCRDFYHEHVADFSVPYPGIRECLDTLAGRTLVVLSNKPQVLCEKLLEKLELTTPFDAIFGPEAFSESKPSPVPITTCLSRYQTKRDHCVMIGDSAQDMVSGRGAAVWTLGVTWGFRSADVLQEAGAHRLATHPMEIPKILADLS